MGAVEEWFDVVDAADKVIGRELRATVHARKLYHRSVHIFVFDSQGRVLIQKRSMLKDSNPGRWTTSCSGHVDSGEVYDVAALRELREEIGIDASQSVPVFLFQVKPCRETGFEFSNVYRLQWNGSVRPDPAEVTQLQWLPVPVLEEWIREEPHAFARSFCFLWKKVQAPGIL